MLKLLGKEEVKKLIEEYRKQGHNVEDLELWLSGKKTKNKQAKNPKVLEYKIGEIVSWEHKGKKYFGKVYKLNRVTVGIEENGNFWKRWTVAPEYLNKYLKV